MGYWISESYGILLVTELVDAQNPWVITGYGLSQVWVKTESTVSPSPSDLSHTVASCNLELPGFSPPHTYLIWYLTARNKIQICEHWS